MLYCTNPTQALGLGQIHIPSRALALSLLCGPNPGPQCQVLRGSTQASVSKVLVGWASLGCGHAGTVATPT